MQIGAVTPIQPTSALLPVSGKEKQNAEGLPETAINKLKNSSVAKQGTLPAQLGNLAKGSNAVLANEEGENKQQDLGLTEEDRREVRSLQETDRKVRAHEQAHRSAGGNLTSPATFSYREGPDGKRYAVAGEVKVDTSPVKGDPEATIRKMDRVRAAALAPGDPSPADIAVAASAQAKRQAAVGEKAAETRDEFEETAENKAEVEQAVAGDATENVSGTPDGLADLTQTTYAPPPPGSSLGNVAAVSV